MILGRQTSSGRIVKLWDMLEVKGKLNVNGGSAMFSTKTGTHPLIVSRLGGESEQLRIGVLDHVAVFHYHNDEASSRIDFRMENTDTERADNKGTSANDNVVFSIIGNNDGGYVDAKHIKQPSWTAARFNNGWGNFHADYNSGGYFKDSQGIVHLRGRVKGENANSYQIFVLPEECRPEKAETHSVCMSKANVTNDYELGRITITTGGGVTLQRGDRKWVSLDGITFRAGKLS
jgi:hypothetical protein